MNGKQVSGGWYGQGGGLTHLVVNWIIKIQNGDDHYHHHDYDDPGARCRAHGPNLKTKGCSRRVPSIHQSSNLELPLTVFLTVVYSLSWLKSYIHSCVHTNYRCNRSNMPSLNYDWMLEYRVVSWMMCWIIKRENLFMSNFEFFHSKINKKV